MADGDGRGARRLIKTHAQMEEAVAATKERPFISKPSQDFLRRVVQTSGVSDATAHPEGVPPCAPPSTSGVSCQQALCCCCSASTSQAHAV